MSDSEPLIYSVTDRVATITLNRPDRLNSFDPPLAAAIVEAWREVRSDPDVDVAIVTGTGDRAFTTGVDLDADRPQPPGKIVIDDDVHLIGPKTNDCWKPVIAAVNGMACGGAIYLLGEADLIVAADHATFFDPHVTHGMPAIFEPALLLGKLPLGEVLQIALLGRDVRMTAARAHELGFVQRVTSADDLLTVAGEIAAIIASAPDKDAVGATLKAVWLAHRSGIEALNQIGSTLVNLIEPTSEIRQRAARIHHGSKE